jgi:hypothetical protein
MLRSWTIQRHYRVKFICPASLAKTGDALFFGLSLYKKIKAPKNQGQYPDGFVETRTIIYNAGVHKNRKTGFTHKLL